MNAVVQRQESQTEVSALIQAIERAAVNPAVDVDKMERLFALQERMLARNAEMQFNAALTAAQADMGRISADAVNPQTSSKYATYGKLDSVLRPIYTKHGFSLSFNEGVSPEPDHVLVICHVAHVDGHSRAYQKNMPADGKGAKGGDVMTKTHAAGAAMSYGMRYLLKGIFNVAIGEEDNDGNGAPVPRINESQAADLQALAEEIGVERAGFLKYLRVEKLSDLPATRYADAIAALNKKRKAK
jgi:hypothetical protein